MATLVNPADITPRQVANKSDKKALLDAIRMTLGVQSAAIRLNTQTFNRNRYAAIGAPRRLRPAEGPGAPDQRAGHRRTCRRC